MPYLEVLLNDKKLSVGGDRDIDLLVLTLIATKERSSAQLCLSGMRKVGNDKSEAIEWARAEVNHEDRVRLVALENATPSTPISVSTSQMKPIQKIAEDRQTDFDVDGAIKLAPGSYRPTFEIAASDSSRFRADIQEEETLQLVLTWHGRINECKFEVDSLTVMEDGYTKGQHWADGRLKAEDWMEIRVIEVGVN
jgi:hypothetical protein